MKARESRNHRRPGGAEIRPLDHNAVTSGHPHAHLAKPHAHRWLASLLVAALVAVGFGGWRLVREGPDNQSSAQLTTGSRSTTSPGLGDSTMVSQSSVRIRADGTLEVTERLTLAGPQTNLTVSIAARSGFVGRFDPRVEDFRLRVEGQREQRLTVALTGASAESFLLPADAKSAVLEYSVTGAVVASQPSAAGRALAWVTPLTIGPSQGTPMSTTEITGRGLLNIGCTRPGGALTTCGRSHDGGWVVERGPDHDVLDVVAQVNLAGVTLPDA